ncbi:MAG: hypothetical protein FWE09_00670 [Treponema sp.]|nr:hypothetical protein [Treponema sp.]
MRHVFIIDQNIFSGQISRIDALQDSISEHFRAQDNSDYITAISKFPRAAFGIIQEQIDGAGGDTLRVYAIGGDGILFDCLNAIVGIAGAELACMPAGAPNALTRYISDRRGWTEEAEEIVGLDVIEVGNNYAISGCSVGLGAAAAIRINEWEAARRGSSRRASGLQRWLRKIALAHKRDVAARQYRIVIDGEDYSGRYSLVSVANAPGFGRTGARLDDSQPNDGFLDVALFKPAAPLSTLSSHRRYAAGKMPRNCLRLKAKKVEVESDRAMFIQTDGEYLMDTSISFEVNEGAVAFVTVDELTRKLESTMRRGAASDS